MCTINAFFSTRTEQTAPKQIHGIRKDKEINIYFPCDLDKCLKDDRKNLFDEKVVEELGRHNTN